MCVVVTLLFEAQMRMIRDGEAMPLEQDSEPSDDDEQEDEQLESSEDDDAEKKIND